MKFGQRKIYFLTSIRALSQKIRSSHFYVLPFGVFALICTSTLFIDTWNRSLSSVIISSIKRQKPIMHTFWESVPGGCCGATEVGHQQLFDAWTSSWQLNGWDTKILTIDDAKRHPEYQRMSDLLNNFEVSEYDQRCFYRWLAIANQPGGGWMSDYDIFPTHFTAKETYELIEKNGNGKFTSYAHVAPALIYANHDEWNRMAKMLMSYMSEDVFKGTLMTDFYVFKQIVEERRADVGIVYEPDGFVSKIGFSLYDTDRHTLDCDTVAEKGTKAVHFSHFSCYNADKDGRFPIPGGAVVQNRGLAAALFTKDFNEQCVNSR